MRNKKEDMRQKIQEEQLCQKNLIEKELRDALETCMVWDDNLLLEELDKVLMLVHHQNMPLEERLRYRKEIYYSVRKMDVLQELLEDPDITEIMVNGYKHIFYEKAGKLYQWERGFSNEEKLMDVILQIVGSCNRVVNESMPIVDARLVNGDRVNVVVAPAAINGPILTIRKFPDHPIDMKALIQKGTLTEEAADYLKELVRGKCTIVIGGGTSTGKTTFLNALSAYIPSDERIITIEETAELQLQNIPNLVRLEEKHANMTGSVSVTMRELIRSALRMRPDRIIVGEMRGEEAVEMLFSAVNTGHRGSLCTAHANSCFDMVSRLETMVLMGLNLPMEAIDRQIGSGIDILVHLTRGVDGMRRVTEIVEVTGYHQGQVQLHPLFQWDMERGLVQVGERKGVKMV